MTETPATTTELAAWYFQAHRNYENAARMMGTLTTTSEADKAAALDAASADLVAAIRAIAAAK